VTRSWPNTFMDIYSTAKRAQLMASVRSSGNRSTEIRLASAFRTLRVKGWRRGFKLFGKPDFVFPCLRVAVFVDGCFWHGCPIHYHNPKTNESFWARKVSANKVRDRVVVRELRKRGWTVLRFWEHELRFKAEKVVAQVAKEISRTSERGASR